MTYYATTRGPLGHRTIGTAADLQLDPEGGKWVVICEDHYTVVNTRTLADAKTTGTLDFCEACRAMEGFTVTLRTHIYCDTCDELAVRAASDARWSGSVTATVTQDRAGLGPMARHSVTVHRTAVTA